MTGGCARERGRADRSGGKKKGVFAQLCAITLARFSNVRDSIENIRVQPPQLPFHATRLIERNGTNRYLAHSLTITNFKHIGAILYFTFAPNEYLRGCLGHYTPRRLIKRDGYRVFLSFFLSISFFFVLIRSYHPYRENFFFFLDSLKWEFLLENIGLNVLDKL